MIVCKPHHRAVSSIIIFSVISLVLAFWLRTNEMEFLRFLSGFFLGVGVVLPLRLLYSYRWFRVKKNTLSIKRLLSPKPKKYDLKQLQGLELEAIKTFNANYEQMRLKFPDKTLKISNHEHTNYEALKSYVKRFVPKKKAKA